MKTKIFLILSIAFGLSFQSCEKEDKNLSNSLASSTSVKNSSINNKSGTTIIDEINSDINGNITRENVENLYDYSGLNLISVLRDIHNVNELAYESSTLMNDVELELVSLGYDSADIVAWKSDVQNVIDNETTLSGLISSVNGGEPNNALQADILTEMINYIQLETSYNEMVRISDIFTYHINNSATLSSKEKQDLLTVSSSMKAIADFGDESNWNNAFIVSSSSDPNYIGNASVACTCKPSGKLCATSVLVPLIGGAILGNGLGVIVGFFSGMATAYGNGCMD